MLQVQNKKSYIGWSRQDSRIDGDQGYQEEESGQRRRSLQMIVPSLFNIPKYLIRIISANTFYYEPIHSIC